MDNKDLYKPRRPLPTPGAIPAQRPNTPTPGASTSVAPANFYGMNKAPPLPTRPNALGTSHTAYLAPEEPPSYDPSYREPELITEESMFEEPMPDLIPNNNWDDKNGTNYGGWDSASQWDYNAGSSWTQEGGDRKGYSTVAAKAAGDILIDARDDYEEKNWWNASVRHKCQRPGPGMLPTVLSDELHDTEHSLFSVSATVPDIKSHQSALPPTPTPSNLSRADQTSTPPPARAAWTTTPSSPPPTTASSSHDTSSIPPTEDDVRTSIPHPNAYYCPKENGWVILSWKSSSVIPPLAGSFENLPHLPLPDQDRRKKVDSCIGDAQQPFGQTNKTHHFHKYEKAIDSHKLTPPFRQEEWEAMENVKQRRRGQTIVMDDIDIENLSPEDLDMADREDVEEEGKLLDLYMCCQCSFYCVVSSVIPGVIPRKSFDEFIRDKRNNPQPGRTGEQAVALGFETLIMIIENKLWKGESRLLRANRSSFQSKVGWNSNIKRIFDALGFVEEVYDNEIALRPPSTDINTPEGRMHRRKLLRAWVEISAWVADFRRIFASHFKAPGPRSFTLHVQLSSAREMYQEAIGAHPDQIPRGELSDTLRTALQPFSKAWHDLGLTPMSYTPELLGFGYYAQCRCDPAGTVNYFSYLSDILNVMIELGNCPPSLQEILLTERSRDRFTTEDLLSAIKVLGFGADGPLCVEYDDADIPESFIENAWRECVKKSWKDQENGAAQLRDATQAFKILAEARGSIALRGIWDSGKDKVMNPDRAYDTLEVPKDVDEFMLITIYNMRMEESPSQLEKMREAMQVIAEVRDSERLRQFIATGRDPGEIVVLTRPDLPRGLNQLGNTCYLNSLLQYFYTIKELREAVTPMSKLDLKSVEDEKLSDDDLKRHRVGGRLVTRREIIRSKKFINQLADLFFNMEYSETAAVTPTIELAKLALVTSRDEEEDEADKGGTDSSNDTDATLVDDGPTLPTLTEAPPRSPQSLTRSPNSVLGKRPRDNERQPSTMDLDSPVPQSPSEGYASLPSLRGSNSPPPMSQSSSSKLPEASSSMSQADIDGDVVMRATSAPTKPPPLPPRKSGSDSVMMFGKQHDVAECMDNCMFQIETALLKFDGVDESQGEGSDKTSVVKRLFYGKIRQRLTGHQQTRSSIHEKEDLFSHLPVNVIEDGVDIYDGLSGYFDDVVEFDGEKRRMEVSLVDLPPLLQIQLQRVQFNRDTLQPYKSQAYVKFGETIYMDRFMENADPQKKTHAKLIQSELNSCRDRVRLLLEGKDGPYSSALENTKEFLAKIDDSYVEPDSELISHLNDESNRVKAEIEELRKRTDCLKEELETIWQDNTKIAYELTSVFIHRGSSPSWGHYFFYSRHLPGSPDSWFKYNDSDVTVVSKDEVLADTTGSTANPYLLVFARKGSEVVDTVKRFDPTMLDLS
ncbi:hypothetical protein BDZ94DRAFT_1151478 [Collybia nuda]|uniref:ubiquitinyl hydrolase 1 n=1 Tax=Collybia nuda TaxID=64659 RepID=A0A9P5YKQ5_9AGAR|nr:hypothetical protein BDZ94DRAFT_1151478 [Collybia nuda]